MSTVSATSLSSAATPVPTAEQARLRGEDLGLEGDALETYVRAGAAARHEARVAAARESLMALHPHGMQGEGNTDPAYRTACTAYLAVILSRCRIGGHRGTGRDGLELRYSGLAHLRPNLGGPVGRAWTAAIEEAALHLVEDATGWHCPLLHVRPSTASGEPGLVVRIADGPELWAPEWEWDAQWLRSLSTRVVDEVAQGKGDREDFGMGPGDSRSRWLPAPRINGTLEAWGDLLNRSADRVRESQPPDTGDRYEADPDEKLDADGTVLNADGTPLIVRAFAASDEDRW